jgi:hypothetical protein
MLRLTGFALVLAFASLQVLVAQDEAVQRQRELNELAGKKTETPKTNRIVIGKGQVNFPNNDVKKSNNTLEDPALKAQRREQMAKRKIAREVSKANARVAANAVSRAGSQMVADHVRRNVDTSIIGLRNANRFAGRPDNGLRTSEELSNSSKQKSSSSSSSSSYTRIFYECDRCSHQSDNSISKHYDSRTGRPCFGSMRRL